MEKNILKEELIIVREEKEGQSRSAKYSTENKSGKEIWRDMQDFINRKSYFSALKCLEVLQREGKKNNRALFIKTSLARARICAILSRKKESTEQYKLLIEYLFGTIFLYCTPYSFSIDAFKYIPEKPKEYVFLFQEYYENILRYNKKNRLESLFYKLLYIHSKKEDPWAYFGAQIDLSLLPEHIREAYLVLTTDLAQKKESFFDKKISNALFINHYNSKQYKNYLFSYF